MKRFTAAQMDHQNTVRPQPRVSTNFGYDSGSTILRTAGGGYKEIFGPAQFFFQKLGQKKRQAFPPLAIVELWVSRKAVTRKGSR